VPDLPAGAIVSTRLRPSVEIDVEVTDVALTETEALLRFRLHLGNNGSAGARDLVIEALALNAGEGQEAELASFFQRPDGQEVAIAELGRNSSAQLSHEVRMPRAAIRAYEVQSRRVFVPILAFNVGYRWGSANGRTSAAFLLGHRQPGSDRLAPLGLEDGQRRLATIGVRRLENELRR
jgi:hypothetical protein